MAEHTPGPWEFSSDGIWAISPWNARVRIATVAFFSPMNGIDGNVNGRTLAAAPDMLAALHESEREVAETIADIVGARAANVIGAGHSRFDEASAKELARLEAVLCRIRAAIAKAELSSGDRGND